MENKILIYDNSLYDAKKGLFVVNPLIETKKLRQSILYWDKIVVPCVPDFFVGNLHSPGIYEIASAGIVEQIYTDYPQPGEMAQSLYNAHMGLMLKLFSDKKDNYTAYDIGELFIGRSDVQVNGGELIYLVNAIPQPSEDVSITELLEFKEKRKDELRTLMTHLNSLELRIREAETKDTEFKKCINEIDIACRDIIRLYKERNIKFNLSNATFNFSMKEMIEYGGSAYAATKLLGLPETASIIAGTIAGISSAIEIKDAISFKKIDKTNPYNYVGEISVKLS